MRRLQRVLFLSVVLTATLVAAAQSVTLSRVRYSAGQERTRVVIDASGPCSYEVAEHVNPDRIAINIRGARGARSLGNISVGKGGVRRVRINRLSWGTQVVIDLDGPAEWKHFRLSRSGSRPDRIVVDLAPARTAVPQPAAAAARTPSGRRLITVAIDPGHGGKDAGTLGRYGLVEKRLTLDIARRLQREINAVDGFRAVLTRTRDVYLDLPRRVELAREKGADVFVSVHLNAAPNRSARGVEIFFVSPSGARRSARQVLSNPGRAASDYGLSGSDSDVLHMIVDLNQQTVLERSEALAESILRSMSTRDMPPTRAVKQKSFAVLRNISMPSVLVEAGFISNTTDAKFVRTEAGRNRIAETMGEGVVRYLRANPPQRIEDESLIVHRVRKGDTLWKISRTYNTSVTSIRTTNKLNSNVLRVGQELLVSRGY